MTEQDKQNFINAFGFEKASEIINETMTGQQQKALDALASASKPITEEVCRFRDKISDHSFIDADAELERIKKNQVVGIKHDEGKTKFHLLIPEFVKGVADVMTKGAEKYSEWNYLYLDKERIVDAHHRHMNAYQRGELNDPETGLSHLFHATCCLQMLWALDNNFHGKEEKK